MKLFYSPDARNLASLYLLERDYDLNKYSLESVIRADLKTSDSILRSIIFTIETDEPIEELGSKIKASKKSYLQTMTLNDALNYLIKHPDNKPLRNLVLNSFPSVLTEQIGKIKNISIRDSSEVLSKDKACSIYFLDNLECLMRFINQNYQNPYLRDIIPLTIRLYIPKEYFQISFGTILDPKSVIYKSPLILNGHLVYETISGITDKKIRDKLANDSQLYYEFKDESILSGLTVYSTILSMTISKWIKFIDGISGYENKMAHPVVSSIIYFLRPYTNLAKLFNKNEVLK